MVIKLLNCLAVLTVLAVTVSGLDLWYRTYIVGGYYQSAELALVLAGGVAPLVLMTAAIIVIGSVFSRTKDIH